MKKRFLKFWNGCKTVKNFLWEHKEEVAAATVIAAGTAVVTHKVTKCIDKIEHKKELEDLKETLGKEIKDAHEQGVLKGIVYDVYESRHMPEETIDFLCDINKLDRTECSRFRESIHNECTELKKRSKRNM